MRLLTIALVLVFLGCSKKPDGDVAQNRDELRVDQASKIAVTTIPDIIDVDLSNRKSGLNTSEVISADHKIIKLETTDDCLIGEISKVLIRRGRIFVFDEKISKSLYCFNLLGKSLFKVGTLGSGPGEMDTPRDFDVTDENIYLIDRQCRLFTFTLSGKYQSTFRLPFLTTQFCVLNDTSIFYYTGSMTDNFRYYLTRINRSEVTSFNFPIQSEIVGGFDIPQAFHKHGNEILFVKFLCDTIFTITDDTINALYVLNFEGKYANSIFQNRNDLENVYLDPDTYGKLFNKHMAATSDDLFFLSSNRGINYHFISKASGKHIFTDNINDDFMLGGVSLFPVGSDHDYLIYPITIGSMSRNYAALLRDSRARGLEKDFISRYGEAKALYEQSNQDDNPALLLTKINPKIYEE